MTLSKKTLQQRDKNRRSGSHKLGRITETGNAELGRYADDAKSLHDGRVAKVAFEGTANSAKLGTNLSEVRGGASQPERTRRARPPSALDKS